MTTTTRRRLMKVPEITALFWVAKLLSTAFGEATSDYVFFNDYIGQHLAIVLGLGFLLGCLALQFLTKRASTRTPRKCSTGSRCCSPSRSAPPPATSPPLPSAWAR